MIKRNTILAISLCGGLFTGLAWVGWLSGLLLLVSFVPVFYIEQILYDNRKTLHRNSVFVFLLPYFLIFNIIALGWVSVASIAAAIFIILVSSFLMTFIVWSAHIIRIRAGNILGYCAFISIWLSFELINLNFSLLHPWLNLGNGLAGEIKLIQWYDVTGTGGGTIWIIVSGLLISKIINPGNRNGSGRVQYSITLFLWITVPAAISIYKYNSYSPDIDNMTEVVIIQPNKDPYTEKFTIPFTLQLESILSIADANVTTDTKWLILPETTIDDKINESDFSNDKYVERIKQFLSAHNTLSVIIGATTFNSHPSGVTDSNIKMASPEYSTEVYNSALMIDTSIITGVYHKSKLVPGFEKKLDGVAGRIIASLLPDLGGTQPGYTVQKERTVFEQPGTGQKTAAVICFESVYGEFVSGWVNKGAELIFIITNDGWWKNTNGYRQHLRFASLRAIETRRYVARSANTGVSCIIDPKGIIAEETEWWKTEVIRAKISGSDTITFYSRYGDFLLRGGAAVALIIIFFTYTIVPLKQQFKSAE